MNSTTGKLKLITLFTAVYIILTSMAMVGPTSIVDSIKGADTRQELEDILFQSIKANKFDMLINYIPDENLLNVIKTKSDIVEQNLYENLNPQQLLSNTESNFNLIIKKGIDTKINWESLQIMNKSSKGYNSLNNVYTIDLLLQDNRENKLPLSFDAMQINEKWFLFQNIRIVKDSLEVGYNKN